LLFQEFDSVFNLLNRVDSEQYLKKEIEENKYLRLNSEASRIRVVTELKKRSKSIDSEFYSYYPLCSDQEKRLLLFHLILQVYPLVFEFHFDVTIESWKLGRTEIDQFLYQMKLDEICTNDEAVDGWTDSTKLKVITRYLHILDQSGFILNNRIKVINATDNFWCFFIKNGSLWFLDACLLSNEKKSYLKTLCL